MGYKRKNSGIIGILKSGHAPGLRGVGKRYQFCYDRPNPYEELKRESLIRERAGKMTPEMKRNTARRLKSLKAKQESGRIKMVDYGKEGHPLEK